MTQYTAQALRKSFEVTGYTTTDGSSYCVPCSKHLFGEAIYSDWCIFPIFLGTEFDKAPNCDNAGCLVAIECIELNS